MWAEGTCTPTGRAPWSRGRLSTTAGRTAPVPSCEASARRRGCPRRTCLAVTTEIHWYRQTLCACMSQTLHFFYRWKVYGNPMLSRSLQALLSAASAHFVPVSHFSTSCNISNFFIIPVSSMISVICYLRCYYCQNIMNH